MIPAGAVERGERKRTADEASKALEMMSKPGAHLPSGISSEDALKLTERHPAYRRHEFHPGSFMERENLVHDVKRKSASGSTVRLKVPMRE